MRLPFCGCGQPLWTPVSQEREFCEHCRLHHSTHWPPFGHHPRTFPYLPPAPPYENPYHEADDKPLAGLHLMRGVIHRHECPLLDGLQVLWQWGSAAKTGEIIYAAAYFGYSTCTQCRPLATVV